MRTHIPKSVKKVQNLKKKPKTVKKSSKLLKIPKLIKKYKIKTVKKV